jgi:hypothetical protein
MPSIFQDILNFFEGNDSPAAVKAKTDIATAESSVQSAIETVAVDVLNEALGKIPLATLAEPAADSLLITLINTLVSKLSDTAKATLAVDPSTKAVTMAPIPDQPGEV